MENKLVELLNGKNVVNLFLIRHPEVENHNSKVFNGSIDVGLSENGNRQAESVVKYFKDKVKIVYSSPLKRCRVVADRFNDVEVVVDDRLRERSFGIFESLNWQQIERKYPKEASSFLEDPFNFRVPLGESFYDVENRVKGFVDEILNISEDVLVISHGGVNRVIIKLILGLNEKSILRISQDYICVNHFKVSKGWAILKLLNGQICF